MFLLALFIAAGPVVRAAPLTLPYSGRITAADGSPLAGPIDFSIRFFRAASGGDPLLNAPQPFAKTTVVDGAFQLPIQLAPADFQTVFPDVSTPVFIELSDDTHQKVYPRQQLQAVPFAGKVPVDGKTVTYDSNGELTLTTPPGAQVGAAPVGGGAPGAGQVLQFNGTQWVPTTLPPAPGQASAGAAGILAASDWAQFNAAPSKSYVDGLSAGALKKDGSVPLTATWNEGCQDITNTGSLVMVGSKTFGLSVATSDPGGLGVGDTGKIWYNGGIRLWNGTSAQSLGIAGGGIQSLNGLNGSAQSFAYGTTGTAPAWVPAGSTHTFNIPMANASGAVTAGLITNAEWALFNGKQPLLPPATFTANGFLASSDWAVFNAKQNVLNAATGAGAGFLTQGDWTAFNGKDPYVTPGTTAQYYRGDKSWQTLNTANVAEAGNLYYTSARAVSDARGAINANAPLQYSGTTGSVTLPPATIIANGYLASGDWTAFNAKQNALGAAGSGSPGYLSAADWNSFNGRVASVGAGTNIAVTGSALAPVVGITGQIPLANGGTGANTAAAALTSLGAVAKAGDTMTGTLTLPAGGLAVGTSQLVVSGGNVGIGTSTPNAMLHVAGSNPVLRLANTGSTGVVLEDLSSLAYLLNQDGTPLAFGTNGNEVMRINDNGSWRGLGIGSTNPAAILDVVSPGAWVDPIHSTLSSTNTTLSLPSVGLVLSNTNATSGNHTSLMFSDGASNPYSAGIAGIFDRFNHSGELAFFTTSAGNAYSERIRINNAGNVGIGTTNPAAKLHVGGTAGVDGIKFPDGTLQTTAAAVGFSSQQVYPSNNTLIVPPGVTQVVIECWGGGGGGGATASGYFGSGGGAGAYGRGLYAVTPGQTLTITIATAGSGGVSGGAAPGNGTASSVTGTGVNATCGGGSGGVNGSATTFIDGGAGGTSAMAFNITGSPGSLGGSTSYGTNTGMGGDAPLGGAGGRPVVSNVPAPGKAPGGGGAGNLNAGANGGAGAVGRVAIWY